MNHKITDFDPKRRRRTEQWRRDRASAEFARYVDRKLPFGSADAYKESGHRHGGRHGRGNQRRYAVASARRNGWGEALSQKKASIRRKYGLSERVDIPPRRGRRATLEAVNTYTGMFN